MNPEELESEEINDKIKEWLETQEEVPEGGFTVQKITRNRGKWITIAQKEYDDWNEKNDVALAIIYNSCKPTCQDLIKEDTIAKEAWERLKGAYSETGFAMVYSQVNVLRNLNSHGVDLNEYINRIKHSKSALEAKGYKVHDDIYSAMLLNGLDTSFYDFVRNVLLMDLAKDKSFEEIMQIVFNETLARNATVEKEHMTPIALKTNESTPKSTNGTMCKACGRKHKGICWNENPVLNSGAHSDWLSALL